MIIYCTYCMEIGLSYETQSTGTRNTDSRQQVRFGLGVEYPDTPTTMTSPVWTVGKLLPTTTFRSVSYHA